MRTLGTLLVCMSLSGCTAAVAEPAAAGGRAPAAAEAAPVGVSGDWPDPRPPVAGSCVSRYPDRLAESAVAFDATVVSVAVAERPVEGDAHAHRARLGLAVHEVLAGSARTKVTMRAWDFMLPRDPRSMVGLRILASAGDTLDLRACGYSRPYSRSDAEQWRTVFARR